MKNQAILELKRLHLQSKIDKYKQTPGYDLSILKPYDYKQNSANAITRCIVDYIQLKGGQAERISTTGRIKDNTKTYVDVCGFTRKIGSTQWIPGTNTPGSADISAVIDGRAIKIEVKFKKDKQSKNQKNYEAAITKAGGIYLIATSFDQIKPQIDNLFDKMF